MSRYSQKGISERQHMLEAIGAPSLESLFDSIPTSLQLQAPLDLPPAHSEDRLMRRMGGLAAQNADTGRYVSFMGAGFYDHFIPAAVKAIASRSEFATAYTPYQAEVSQGTLQVIFEFQSLMCALTGMHVANASMYDAGSAMAEAIHLAVGAKRRQRVLVSAGVHPHYLEVAKTLLEATGVRLEVLPEAAGRLGPEALANAMGDDVACAVVQHPNLLGLLEPMATLAETTQRAGALFVAVVDPVSLGILAPPADYGADIAVGEGQALGADQSWGGPGFGFFAAAKAHLRRLPGRLVGETVDTRGRRGFVLTLQTREQHIRRERATSNICTNQGLVATAATIHMCLLGPAGIREMAEQCAQRAHYLANALECAGAPRTEPGAFFREFAVTLPVGAAALVKRGLDQGILAGVPLETLGRAGERQLLVAVTERRSRDDLDRLAALVRRAAVDAGVLQEA